MVIHAVNTNVVLALHLENGGGTNKVGKHNFGRSIYKESKEGEKRCLPVSPMIRLLIKTLFDLEAEVTRERKDEGSIQRGNSWKRNKNDQISLKDQSKIEHTEVEQHHYRNNEKKSDAKE